ncbi:MAG: polyprenyl synthetase family protein [Bdellovibrionales bacterium]
MRNIKIFDQKDFPSYLPKLNALYDDLFSSGKGFRAKLIQMMAGHLKLSERHIHLLCQTIEFIHNASLLHDDLIDRSALRRNKTAAWLKYSPEYAVLAGDYLLARVMVNLSRNGNLRLIQYTAEIISDLLEGEWMQDSLVGDIKVGLDDLNQVHALKTASLFKWCLRAPFIAQENYSDDVHQVLEELGGILGLLFQRSDDLLDFDIRNFEGKAILGDLKSGYLNSFGAFLAKPLSEEQRRKLKQTQTLEEVRQLIGEERFNAAAVEFDRMNQQAIELYLHHIDNLGALLKPDETGLLKDLSALPKPLYWRK